MSAEAYLASKGIRTVKTDQPVGSLKPELVTRFRSRADRRARKLNEAVLFPSYRWEVVRWPDDPKDKIGTSGDRWAVVAMQNVAVSDG